MDAGSTWHLMQDGVAFVEFNHQGGPRGGRELVVPNWWMGMASRAALGGRLTFTSMLSLDAATIGKSGYRQLFQVGEAVEERPLIDRQHPHDFVMQLAAVWRRPLDRGGFTLAAAAAGEPALGPIAFMHRASAVDNPTAPLGHHTLDSTHIAFGVITAAVDRGPWIVEGSVFNGREPDEHRWDFDFGPLDSYSGRVWYRPTSTSNLNVQVSAGRLVDPEELEPGIVTRTTASAGWTWAAVGATVSVSAGFGRNDAHGVARHAFFLEGLRWDGRRILYGRFEAVQTETALLASGVDEQEDHQGESPLKAPVFALTFGVVRDVLAKAGFEGGVGADLTYYFEPELLRPEYGDHPFGARVFFRLRLPAGSMGRMTDTWMTRP
jgi:hypothetical protein